MIMIQISASRTRNFALTLLLMLAASTTLFAQNHRHSHGDVGRNQAPSYGVSFLDQGEKVPDALLFLPAPPAFDSSAFTADSIGYVEAKKLRDTERGEQAIDDAKTSIKYYMKRFSPAVGLELNPEDYPELATMMKGVAQDVRGSIQNAKHTYARQRPYQHFHEGTPIPEDECEDDFTSYPSGHTVRGWALAMLLSNVFPEHASEIMKVGYEIGYSRVIVGFHYLSDVENARYAASAGYTYLCSKEAFQQALKSCRAEAQTAELLACQQ